MLTNLYHIPGPKSGVLLTLHLGACTQQPHGLLLLLNTMCDQMGEIMTLFLCPDFLKIDTLLLCLTLAYIPIYCVSSGTRVYDEYHKDKNDGVQTKYF